MLCQVYLIWRRVIINSMFCQLDIHDQKIGFWLHLWVSTYTTGPLAPHIHKGGLCQNSTWLVSTKVGHNCYLGSDVTIPDVVHLQNLPSPVVGKGSSSLLNKYYKLVIHKGISKKPTWIFDPNTKSYCITWNRIFINMTISF